MAVTATLSDGPTLVSVSTLDEDGIAVARVDGTGMVKGQSYTLTFHFELASGQEDDRSLTLFCDER